MSIIVTLNDEQIRAAIHKLGLKGPVLQLDLSPSDVSTPSIPKCHITYKTKHVVSAEQSLSLNEIECAVRSYLGERHYTLSPEATVIFQWEEDKGYIARVNVLQVPAEESNEESAED